MIYMIAGLGVVKIGFTNDVKRRLSTLQTGHTRPLKVIRLFEGGPAEEARLHALFADVRTKGEWFTFVAEMLGDVGLVEISLTTLRKKYARQEVAAPTSPEQPLPNPDPLEPSDDPADEGFDKFKAGLIRAFGSLRNATVFMDIAALPWIEHRLDQSPARLSRQTVSE